MLTPSCGRRTLLSLGVASFALLSIGARGPGVEIEGDGVESTTSGGTGCGCGPIYRARTAGAAAGVRISEHARDEATDRGDGEGEGISVEARGAWEREAAAQTNGGWALSAVVGWFRAGLEREDAIASHLPVLGDPTLALLAQAAVPIARHFRLVSTAGLGGVLEAARGNGADATISLGLLLSL